MPGDAGAEQSRALECLSSYRYNKLKTRRFNRPFSPSALTPGTKPVIINSDSAKSPRTRQQLTRCMVRFLDGPGPVRIKTSSARCYGDWSDTITCRITNRKITQSVKTPTSNYEAGCSSVLLINIATSALAVLLLLYQYEIYTHPCPPLTIHLWFSTCVSSSY